MNKLNALTMKTLSSVLILWGMTYTANLYAEVGVESKADKKSETEILVLEAITVEGEPGVLTEGTKSYTSSRVTVGFKHPVDPEFSKVQENLSVQ